MIFFIFEKLDHVQFKIKIVFFFKERFVVVVFVKENQFV